MAAIDSIRKPVAAAVWSDLAVGSQQPQAERAVEEQARLPAPCIAVVEERDGTERGGDDSQTRSADALTPFSYLTCWKLTPSLSPSSACEFLFNAATGFLPSSTSGLPALRVSSS